MTKTLSLDNIFNKMHICALSGLYLALAHHGSFDVDNYQLALVKAKLFYSNATLADAKSAIYHLSKQKNKQSYCNAWYVQEYTFFRGIAPLQIVKGRLDQNSMQRSFMSLGRIERKERVEFVILTQYVKSFCPKQLEILHGDFIKSP